MIHAYNKNGEIVGVVSDGSDEQAAAWVSQGFTVTTGPEIDREKWKYADGVLTAKTPEELDAQQAAQDAAAADQTKILAGTLEVLDLISILLKKGILTTADLPGATATAISTAANVVKIK